MGSFLIVLAWTIGSLRYFLAIRWGCMFWLSLCDLIEILLTRTITEP